jgi:hypothetical protein
MNEQQDKQNWFRRHRTGLIVGAVALLVIAIGLVGVLPKLVNTKVKDDLYDGRLVAADYWTSTPEILSSGLGFDGVIGLPALDEESVRAAGGAWASELDCGSTTPDEKNRTSAVASDGLEAGYVVEEGDVVEYGDGLPVVFSWPVRTDTIHPSQFRFTLNTGEVVVPTAAGDMPNWERNERNVVVVFGDFGNRIAPGEPGAEFPVRLDIVEGTRPLVLVGPGGDESAVGLSNSMDNTGYGIGPTLVGAKLNRVDPTPLGEGGVFGLENDLTPNDERALYGDQAAFRLRMLTTGGFKPDGVRGVHPDQFERYFRLHAKGADGTTVILDKVGVDYQVAGGTLRILGLSDLGQQQESYDDCYAEDGDNYIDVILAGDEAAARHVTTLEMPGIAGGYEPLYNPGGPGPTPFPGVVYTEPSPPIMQPVTIALDYPMRVDR